MICHLIVKFLQDKLKYWKRANISTCLFKVTCNKVSGILTHKNWIVHVTRWMQNILLSHLCPPGEFLSHLVSLYLPVEFLPHLAGFYPTWWVFTTWRVFTPPSESLSPGKFLPHQASFYPSWSVFTPCRISTPPGEILSHLVSFNNTWSILSPTQNCQIHDNHCKYQYFNRSKGFNPFPQKLYPQKIIPPKCLNLSDSCKFSLLGKS